MMKKNSSKAVFLLMMVLGLSGCALDSKPVAGNCNEEQDCVQHRTAI